MSKIVVGVSGGVDSSTVLATLLNQGHEVVAVTLTMQHGSVAVPSPDDIERARHMCEQFNVEFIVRDVSKDFHELVVEKFLDEYEVGRTPNPCIICNPLIKFAALESIRLQLGFDLIATGHYASLVTDPFCPSRSFVARGTDPLKDQSYFLYRVDPSILGHCVFPLASVTKTQTRQIARDLHLESSDLKDSTGICFAQDGDYRNLVRDQRPEMLVPGDIVTTTGEVLGKHKGCALYTYGQRKGLGLGGGPWFIVGIDVKTHTVRVEHGEFPEVEHLRLYQPVVWRDIPQEGLLVEVQTRYHLAMQKALVKRVRDDKTNEELLDVCLVDGGKVFACPGQSCVIFYDDVIVGGGFIL